MGPVASGGPGHGPGSAVAPVSAPRVGSGVAPAGTPGAAAPAPTPTPLSVEVRLADAGRLVNTGEWEQAAVVLEKARRENPDDARPAYELANLCLEHKRWAEGAQAARAAGDRDHAYRGDERLVNNLIVSLGTDKGYERSEDVLHGFGAGAVPFLKTAAAHDKNPVVRERAAELLRSHASARTPGRPGPSSSRSSHKSFFSR